MKSFGHITFRNLSLGLTAVFALNACGNRNDPDSSSVSDDDAETLANAGSEAVNSVATSQGLVALRGVPRRPSLGTQLLEAALPSAWAAACSSALSSCSSVAPYVKSRAIDCTLGSRNVGVVGSVQLEYSNAGCSLASAGSVVRTSSVTRTGAGGRVFKVDSDSHQDYRGNTIGGGQKLSVAADGSKTLEVLGMRRQLLSADGTVLADVSTRSIEPFAVTGSSFAALNASGGKFEVIHNKAEYVATWTSQDIVWSADCECPSSGSVSAELSGSKTGTLKLEFGACGEATLTKSDGSTLAVDLDHCAKL